MERRLFYFVRMQSKLTFDIQELRSRKIFESKVDQRANRISSKRIMALHTQMLDAL